MQNQIRMGSIYSICYLKLLCSSHVITTLSWTLKPMARALFDGRLKSQYRYWYSHYVSKSCAKISSSFNHALQLILPMLIRCRALKILFLHTAWYRMACFKPRAARIWRICPHSRIVRRQAAQSFIHLPYMATTSPCDFWSSLIFSTFVSRVTCAKNVLYPNAGAIIVRRFRVQAWNKSFKQLGHVTYLWRR